MKQITDPIDLITNIRTPAGLAIAKALLKRGRTVHAISPLADDDEKIGTALAKKIPNASLSVNPWPWHRPTARLPLPAPNRIFITDNGSPVRGVDREKDLQHLGLRIWYRSLYETAKKTGKLPQNIFFISGSRSDKRIAETARNAGAAVNEILAVRGLIPPFSVLTEFGVTQYLMSKVTLSGGYSSKLMDGRTDASAYLPEISVKTGISSLEICNTLTQTNLHILLDRI